MPKLLQPSPNQAKKFALFFVFLFLLLVPGVFHGMPSEFVPEIDCEVPMGSIRFFADYSNYKSPIQYPAFAYTSILPLYGTSFLFFKATNMIGPISSQWPFGLRDPVSAMVMLIVLRRLVSVLFALGVLYSVYVLLTRIRDRLSASIGALLIAFSGVFIYYARAANPDMQQIFFWATSLLFLFVYLQNHIRQRSLLLFSAALCALGIATKDQNAAFMISSIISIFLLSREKLRIRILDSIQFSAIVLLVYFLFAIAPNPIRWVHHIAWIRNAKAQLIFSPKHLLFAHDAAFAGYLGLALESLRYIIKMVSPAGSVFSIVGIVALSLRRKWSELSFLLLPAITHFLLFIVGARVVHERYLLNTAILLIILSAIGISEFSALIKRSIFRRLHGAVVALIIIMQFSYGYMPVTFAQVIDTKNKLAMQLSRLIDKTSSICWYGTQVSFPNAKVYTEYKLNVSEENLDEFGSQRLLSQLQVGNQCDYLLADRDLKTTRKDQPLIDAWRRPSPIDISKLELVATIASPSWVVKHASVYETAHRATTFAISSNYFIYKITP